MSSRLLSGSLDNHLKVYDIAYYKVQQSPQSQQLPQLPRLQQLQQLQHLQHSP